LTAKKIGIEKQQKEEEKKDAHQLGITKGFLF
jgi:hypothetical protein